MELARVLFEERASGPLEPDFITPEQYRDRVRRELSDQPELRLMLAVMGEAIATYQRFAAGASQRNRRLFDDAERWIRSTDRSWPYSFTNICQALSFDPDALRRGLQAWRKEQLSRPGRVTRFRIRAVPGKRRALGVG
ncbi:MAG TPA: hypothetical protein VEI94_11230 [Candidatus Bathyarchaeia archaeon]|nr:hypothetical protein [Candidatus Bathyarchaeia archaeon]